MTAQTVEYMCHSGDDRLVVNAATSLACLGISNHKRNAIIAYEKGYRITKEGKFLNPRGKALPIRCYGTAKYPTFTVTKHCKVLTLSLHHLAAYCFYGVVGLLSEAVRHINGNKLDLSIANVMPGTHVENNSDIPEAIRKSKAVLARRSQGFTPANAKLSREEVLEVKKFYADLQGCKAPSGTVAALGKRLGVSRTVLTHIKNRRYYPQV